MLTNLKSTSPVLVMISSKSVPIYVELGGRVVSGKPLSVPKGGSVR